MWSSRTLPSAIAATSDTSSTTRRALAGSASQSPTRAEIVAAATRSRMMSSWRKFSPTNSSSPLPSSSLRFGTSAVCGIGRPSGCLKSAVTANQSAIAPTIDASAPALTKPQKPVASQRGDVHAGSEEQQPDGDRTHPAQPAAPGLVRTRVGRDERDGGLRGGRAAVAVAGMAAICQTILTSSVPECRACLAP